MDEEGGRSEAFEPEILMPAEAAAKAKPCDPLQATILLVEDDDLVRQAGRRFPTEGRLRRHGYGIGCRSRPGIQASASLPFAYRRHRTWSNHRHCFSRRTPRVSAGLTGSVHVR